MVWGGAVLIHFLMCGVEGVGGWVDGPCRLGWAGAVVCYELYKREVV